MKKGISILLLVFLITAMFSMNVAAETTTANGFYNIESADGVVITPYAAESKVSVTNQDVDNDEESDEWYVNSNRLEVSYTSAENGKYYGVILVEGSGTPTKDSTILYIDQVTAESNTIKFNVYPILPEETTDLKLYISSNDEDFELIKIPLNYVVGAEVAAPSYILGDVNGDKEVDIQDAIALLNYSMLPEIYPIPYVGSVDFDKSGSLDIQDAILLLNYSMLPDIYPIG